MGVQFGLALSGGGAKGIAHIGVLKVLEEIHMPVHLLAGTSMGGVIAAVYAAGRSAAEIEQLTRSLRLLDLVQRDRSGLGLIGQGKMAARLREALGGDLTFDQLRWPLALVAVDLQTGEEVVIREGSVVEAVLATTAVPLIFPPVEWRGRLLVDGGILNPVPFDVVRAMGAERVIAVYTTHDLAGRPQDEPLHEGRGAEAVIRLFLHRTRWAPMIDVAERSAAITARELVEQRRRQTPPDVMIEVLLRGVGLLDLDQVDVGLQAGEEAARQHLMELLALRDTPPPSRLTRWWQTVRNRFGLS